MSFVLIALMVFVAPLIAADFHKVVVPATIAALYLVGPLATLAQITPLVGEAEQALSHIETLSERLRPEDRESAAQAVALVQPREIALRKAVFSYRNANGEPVFTIGPISARFRAGSITFVTGGNGSGKSTLLKALTGLFPLDGGELLLDGKVVDPQRPQPYRNLISAVFTDYHLSRRLYGIEDPSPERKRTLLDELGLGGKTDIKDGVFTNIDLSTGQRKRLAFLVAELEDKPVIVLDELAADQDPPMRREFYEKILPSLKARGKIVICATHDDRWFHLADRVYRLDEGRLRRGRGPRSVTDVPSRS
jgi:putative ATP-binding cassette transporter